MNVTSSTLLDTGEWVSYSSQDRENIQEQHKDIVIFECPCQLEIVPTPSEHQMSSSTVFSNERTRRNDIAGLKKLDKSRQQLYISL